MAWAGFAAVVIIACQPRKTIRNDLREEIITSNDTDVEMKKVSLA